MPKKEDKTQKGIANPVKYYLSVGSAALNTFGAVLIFFSFQISSSDFMLVTSYDGRSALCVGSRAMFTITQDGGLGVGTKCPDYQNGRPTAVINTEYPGVAKLGLILIVFGFFFQIFSIEKPHKVEIEQTPAPEGGNVRATPKNKCGSRRSQHPR
jgi:hypothetical protein